MHTDWQAGYARLMTCLMHDDDVTCECCRGDKMPTRKKVYYIACAVILAAWILGSGAWLMFSTYPAVLYP